MKTLHCVLYASIKFRKKNEGSSYGELSYHGKQCKYMTPFGESMWTGTISNQWPKQLDLFQTMPKPCLCHQSQLCEANENAHKCSFHRLKTTECKFNDRLIPCSLQCPTENTWWHVAQLDSVCGENVNHNSWSDQRNDS